LSIFSLSLFYFYQIKSYFQTENLVLFDTKELVLIEKKGFQLNYYSTQKQIDGQDFENYKRENFIEKQQFFELKNFTEIDGQKILILDKPIKISKNIKPDILIIHNNPKMNLERILEKIKPKKVVFTPKNYKKNIDIWNKILTKNKISIYNMYENGYFEF
jgi:competence protein ComEC